MPLTGSEYAMLAAFRFKLRQFLAFSERAATSVGLTQQQYQALLAVRAHGGPGLITITDLANEMLIKHHSAVGMVNRLEELRMVRREPSPEDRRKVGIRLTANGVRVFEKLASIHRGELRRIGRDVGRLMAYFGRVAGEPPAKAAGTRRANRKRAARS
ncbi:MAG TPA: MarR family transcriptional regulator [Usitatibacter sp.]|jgi:DNA-binding MarR family transcriptional regulator|nr:MarR family transcriptional regulator [Usitatibacter sp.]